MPQTEKKSPADIRREVEEAAKKANRNDLIKKVSLWVGVFVVLGGMVYALARYGAAGGPTIGGGTLTDPITSADHAKGNALAKVTVVEYSDFQCPACGAYYPLVKSLEDKYSDRVQFIYRHFPLTAVHRNAMLGALASEAASNQGKFWEMHNMLFDNQTEWSENDNPRDVLLGYADKLRINRDQFNRDLDSAETMARVQRDIRSGDNANVNATPTFFLNNQKVNLQAYGDLEQSIQDALAEKK